MYLVKQKKIITPLSIKSAAFPGQTLMKHQSTHLAGVGALGVGADCALAAGPGEGDPALVHVHAPARPRGVGLVPGGAGAVAHAARDLDALRRRLALGGALAAGELGGGPRFNRKSLA